MEWLQKFNQALDYVEDNLEGEIEYETAARIALNRPLSSRQMKKEKLRHEGLVPVSKGSQAL